MKPKEILEYIIWIPIFILLGIMCIFYKLMFFYRNRGFTTVNSKNGLILGEKQVFNEKDFKRLTSKSENKKLIDRINKNRKGK